MIYTKQSIVYANFNIKTPVFDRTKNIFVIEYNKDGRRHTAFAYNKTDAWSKYLVLQKMLERSFERDRER